MRGWLAAGLIAAMPSGAAGQAAVMETPSARGPTGGIEDGGSARLQRAGVAAPAAVGEWRRYKLVEQSGIGVDAAANYSRGKEQMTLFLYQPINGEVDIHWAGVARGMLEQLGAPAGYPAPQGVADVPSGRFAWETVTSGEGSAILTDLVALARTSGGWYVKVRVSSSTDAPGALAAARSLIAGLQLPDGQTLSPPSLAPIPSCASRVAAGEPEVVKVRGMQKRLTATMLAVLPLAAAGGNSSTVARCRVGEAAMGPITIMLYRSTSPDDPVDYVAALGSGGTTLSLEQTGEQDKGKPVWWLTLDQFKERVVLQQWRGPVDDADFIRSFAELPAIMRAPPVTVVARN